MPAYLLRLTAIAGLLITQLAHGQPLIQTGRYTTVYAIPTEAQRDPLKGIVTVDFPEEVVTVGDAVRHVLAGTGYELSDVLYWETEFFGLVNHRLPDVQRTLGPVSVLEILDVLAGPSFWIDVDTLKREVSFRRTIELDADPEALVPGASDEERPE